MMLRATRLTRANRLIEATALIQSVLRGDIDQGSSSAFETPLSRNSDADYDGLTSGPTARSLASALISGSLAMPSCA